MVNSKLNRSERKYGHAVTKPIPIIGHVLFQTLAYTGASFVY